MSSTPDDDLKHRKAEKRDACWDPAQRWRVLQETITWAEAQAAVHRNTPARCLELQAAKLAALREPAAKGENDEKRGQNPGK